MERRGGGARAGVVNSTTRRHPHAIAVIDLLVISTRATRVGDKRGAKACARAVSPSFRPSWYVAVSSPSLALALTLAQSLTRLRRATTTPHVSSRTMNQTNNT